MPQKPWLFTFRLLEICIDGTHKSLDLHPGWLEMHNLVTFITPDISQNTSTIRKLLIMLLTADIWGSTEQLNWVLPKFQTQRIRSQPNGCFKSLKFEMIVFAAVLTDTDHDWHIEIASNCMCSRRRTQEGMQKLTKRVKNDFPGDSGIMSKSIIF